MLRFFLVILVLSISSFNGIFAQNINPSNTPLSSSVSSNSSINMPIKKGRTTLDFTANCEVIEEVDNWAIKNGFNLIKSSDNQRTYKKGSGLLTAPVMFNIIQDKNNVHIESWISIHPLVRLQSLFILPAEMNLNSGGFRGVVPRRIGRRVINELLLQLEQPPIQ